MENSPKRHNTLEAMLCRRRARRTSMPVEVELTRDGLTVSAVIRDVSLSDDGDSAFIGIGLFHNDALPLNETMSCRTVSPSEVLPVESTVTLMWTRRFGGDGFLSGGRMAKNLTAGDQVERGAMPTRLNGARMTKNPSADDQVGETSETQREAANVTHEEQSVS